MSYQKELRETEFMQIGPQRPEQYNFQNVHLLFKHPVDIDDLPRRRWWVRWRVAEADE